MSAIVATSQQSRFHAETLETTSRNVDLNLVNISVGDLEILVDARLQLSSGTHYGLIGRNGVGKSTLLKAIGEHILPGVSRNLRILYVDQLESSLFSERSVLEVVLESDHEVHSALQCAELLQASLQSGSMAEIAAAVRAVQKLKLKDELAVANEIASRRSGARGFQARAHLTDVEHKLAQLAMEPSSDPAVEPAETETAIEQAESFLLDFNEFLSNSDASNSESRARKILRGLGFTQAMMAKVVSQLSGGWRSRVSLAQALFSPPDLLLLDEPTNNLDLPAILWLQGYMGELVDTTALIVSHDKSFLNSTAEKIILLRHKSLTYFDGNYDEYEETTRDARVYQVRVKDNLDRKKDHIQKAIQNQMRQARSSGDDKKLSQASSRKKKIEKLGVETNAKGHKFKLNRDRPGYHNTVREEAFVEEIEEEVSWTFPEPLELKFPGALVTLEGISYSYESQAEGRILKDVSLTVHQGSRMAFVGKNGQGKSTLLKLIAGRLSPAAGTIAWHSQVKIGYFCQNHLEELREEMGRSSLQLLHEMSPQSTEQILRAHLAGLGLHGAVVLQPISSLSGGQAVRLAMAKVLLVKPQLLLLDEPTNHLDMDTIDAMIGSICSFTGAVIVVSHNQDFVSRVASQVFEIRNAKLQLLTGGMVEYIGRLSSRT